MVHLWQYDESMDVFNTIQGFNYKVAYGKPVDYTSIFSDYTKAEDTFLGSFDREFASL